MPAGQKPTLTPEVQKSLCDAVRLGMPLQRACERAEVGYSTALEWIARGEGTHASRKTDRIYAEFADAIKKARADDQARRLARIEQAARGGAVIKRRTTTVTKPDGTSTTTVDETLSDPCWTADAWHLERSDPEHWGRDTYIIARLKKLLDEAEKKDGSSRPL